MGKRAETRFPCCMYEMHDPEKIYRNLKLELIKEYGEEVVLEDGTVLHKNYDPEAWTGGHRNLVRCRKCGALFLELYETEYDFYDGYFSIQTWVPVASEEEADLLNILLDGNAEPGLPSRRCMFRCDWTYKWTDGAEPVPFDPEKLRERIRAKYENTDPELLEKLIRNAGRDRATEKHPWVKLRRKKTKKTSDPNIKKDYRYLADFRSDPPTLIRLGSFDEMEADMFVFPGVWKDTPRLNDIRVGLGPCMDYDDISEKEAMEIMKQYTE